MNLLISGGIVQAGADGLGQKDTLVGSLDGRDEFLLGVAGKKLYVGDANDSAGFATIKNYERRDRVILSGLKSDYKLTVVGANTQIRTSGTNDLVGIVEGVTGLTASNFGFQTVIS